MNTKDFDSTQLEYLAIAQKLEKELHAIGLTATRIEKEKDDRCTFHLFLSYNLREYKIYRDWRGYIHISEGVYSRYDNLDSYKKSEIYKKYFDSINKIKVLSAKKVIAYIEAIKACDIELETLNAQAEGAKGAYLARIAQLEKDGYQVRYQHNYEKTEITGGRVERNGIELRFEVGNNGYVIEGIEVRTKWEEGGSDKIADFVALSDNKYTA